MLRLVLSFILVVALSGASAASVMHGVSHEAPHTGHHAEMASGDPLTDAEQALADCCDSTGGMGPKSCLGDLTATYGINPTTPKAALTNCTPQPDTHFAGVKLAVPIGPPKA